MGFKVLSQPKPFQDPGIPRSVFPSPCQAAIELSRDPLGAAPAPPPPPEPGVPSAKINPPNPEERAGTAAAPRGLGSSFALQHLEGPGFTGKPNPVN